GGARGIAGTVVRQMPFHVMSSSGVAAAARLSAPAFQDAGNIEYSFRTDNARTPANLGARGLARRGAAPAALALGLEMLAQPDHEGDGETEGGGQRADALDLAIFDLEA